MGRPAATRASSSSAPPPVAPAHPASILKPRFDFKKIIENISAVEKNVSIRKHQDCDLNLLRSLYTKHFDLVGQLKAIQKERNALADKLSNPQLPKQERQAFIERGKEVREAMRKVEEEADAVQAMLTHEALKLPNDTHPDAPLEEQAVLKMIGTRPTFNFQTRTHEEIAELWDLIDFETASKVSGGKFHYLKNEAAELELALVMWAMRLLREKGFTPILTPDIIRPAFAEAAGFRPKSEASQIYEISSHDMCLIGTSEITLAGLHHDKIFFPNELSQLPIKYAGFSHCFRAEVPHRGKMSRGLYRVHQFSKVEMFVVSLPEHSDAMHQELLDIQTDIVSSLGLHARVLDMPSHDLGASAYRKFDIEAWLPSREDFGEVTSGSNCTDFQSRRLNIRFKRDGASSTDFLHTLNATAVATPRLIMAILENFQLEDGRVKIPDVLVPYMGGRTHIGSEMRKL